MLLNAEQLHFQFAPSKKVLDGVSFALETVKVYALLGANGAGKTTLFNLLSGFLRPDAGDITIQGKPTKGKLPYAVNRLGISRIFQDLRLATKLTVKENIKLAMPGNPSDGTTHCYRLSASRRFLTSLFLNVQRKLNIATTPAYN